jgi:formate hydrogenlyase subunit 6/NADH:ubiquinone oxidoreductase subunit I
MPDTSCVFCGNCVGVCPTGALKGLIEWQMEQKEDSYAAND